MFTRLGQVAVHRRHLILWSTLLFVIVAGVVGGGGVFGVLKGGGFEDPGAESTEASELLHERFGAGDPNVVLVLSTPDGVDAPAAAADGQRLTEQVAGMADVAGVASYWAMGSPPSLRSEDGTRALLVARIDGADDDAVEERYHEVIADLEGAGGSLQVDVGGSVATFAEVGDTIEGDLARAESIAVPITMLLLIVVFGSVVAASLPLIVGAVAVVGTFLALFALGSVTDVSIFSINLTTALGLGLAIDYSLFVVSRFREELRAGWDVETAVVRTVERAGRTVAFSGLTVAVALSALLVFPLYFLRSFAYAGVAVVLIAVAASIISLPALLATIGHRVDSWRLLHRPAPEAGTGFWHSLATRVMRRPIPIATAVIALLLLLGAPFLGAQFGLPDDRVLPSDAESRVAADILRDEFGSSEGDSFGVVVPEAVDDGALGAWAGELSSVEGVTRVDSRLGSFVGGSLVAPAPAGDPAAARFDGPAGGAEGTWVSVVPGVEPVSPEGEALAHRLRDVDAPFDVLVGGAAAGLVDTTGAITARLPLAAGIIGGATFVLLFLMFGSLLVPLKALVLNVLSLTATFGAMVWVFQDGHGSDLLDFTPTGTLDTTMPILMFCIAFGLSMDYEVFLLARIKEEHDRTGDTVRSVALGLERTGRIVTAAAALLAVTFVAFATSGVSFIKLFGLGLALAVVVDATIVRATLVPAFMRLAGEANWWAPEPLRRLHERIGLKETVDDDEPPAGRGPGHGPLIDVPELEPVA